MIFEIYIAVAISTFLLLGFFLLYEDEHCALDMFFISVTWSSMWPILILFILVFFAMKFVEEIYEKRI